MECRLRLSTALHFVFFLIVVTSVLGSDQVPVLVWTNDPSIAFPQQLTGHSISHHDFQKSYVKDLTADNHDNVVLFMQDKLSVSDFTQFSDVYDSNDDSNAFKHVKSLMSEMSSAFLPSVSSPTKVLTEVKHMKSRKVKIVDDLHNIVIDPKDGPHLIIVKLPESHHSRKSFSHLDNLIGVVSLQLKAMTRPFIAFYTAVQSSQDDLFQSRRQSRRLMEDSGSGSGIFINASDAFYFYSTNLSISLNSNSTIVSGLALDHDNSNCNSSGNCEVVMTFGEISSLELYDPQFRFQFNSTKLGYWYLSQFVLEYWNKPNSSHQDSIQKSVNFKTDFVDQTPMGYSYHCNNLPAITDTNKTAGVSISFDNFQIQAFVKAGGGFGYYNDCVGFFTTATWMFLISCAILLAVLFFGVIMLLNVSTQDRFDDPKGKTITIGTTEG